MPLAVEGYSGAAPGGKAVGVGDGSRGDFLVIIFALKQLTGFGEGEEGSVDREFILAGIFRDVEDGFDLVAVVAEKLDDEIGIDHACTSAIKMAAAVRDGDRGKFCWQEE
jgi:hypothetical protein